MGKLGNGYGSEFHLLRYLEFDRVSLNSAIQMTTGSDDVEWLPGPPDPHNPGKLREWKGLNFLSHDVPLQSAWRKIWPSTGNPPNWDGVGRVRIGGQWQWLLVEAKAHEGEVASSCSASSEHSRAQIAVTLAATKQALGVSPERDWLKGYYQYCNRLAVLNFLHEQNVPAHLLFIYFIGDKSGSGRNCPQTKTDWHDTLERQRKHVGIPNNHPLQEGVHTPFLPVQAPVA
ncbi:hypothetical protein LB516_16305 [Mesorhizobium sp. CO1-1-7]|uniref:hypothetical protein n=1 Tax=Mesorhizobium sp. CO1-1-7 TaxID=2876632 RepID=UPI001CD0E603|nr:hypothetical protein [Mesorhizobium sp. CO1-1-7]MBZ9746812.1 hypothetical protein [Mesorhizobium sp. CO1-1-7]